VTVQTPSQLWDEQAQHAWPRTTQQSAKRVNIHRCRGNIADQHPHPSKSLIWVRSTYGVYTPTGCHSHHDDKAARI
jgi:hypothetical protein